MQRFVVRTTYGDGIHVDAKDEKTLWEEVLELDPGAKPAEGVRITLPVVSPTIKTFTIFQDHILNVVNITEEEARERDERVWAETKRQTAIDEVVKEHAKKPKKKNEAQ